MMFFHARGGLTEPIHEWSGLLLVAGVALHLVANWKALCIALKSPWAITVAAVFGVATVAAILPLGGDAGRHHVPPGGALKRWGEMLPKDGALTGEPTERDAGGVAMRIGIIGASPWQAAPASSKRVPLRTRRETRLFYAETPQQRGLVKSQATKHDLEGTVRPQYRSQQAAR
jgi:hypothetical protein